MGFENFGDKSLPSSFSSSASSSISHLAAQTCVVIPAYQAEEMVAPLVKSIRSQGLIVVVVDDASVDATALKAEEAGAMVIRRPVNGGKGAALRQGLSEALKGKFQWFLTIDADGQHLPEELSLFLAEAAAGSCDLIVGNRMWNPRGMPFERRFTNWFMSRLLFRITKQRVPDTQCGYRIVSRRALENICLTADRYEIDSEFVVKAAWAGFTIKSIPISSVYRRELSFIRPFQDTVRFFRFLATIKRPSV